MKPTMTSIMNAKTTLMTVVLQMGVMAICSAQSALAAELPESQSEATTSTVGFLPERAVDTQLGFRRTFYGAIGFGASHLDPVTDALPGVDVNDRVQGAAQLALGYDLSKHLSLEANAARLGSAGLYPEGEVSYATYGASALLFAGKNRHRYLRHGLTGFARMGFGTLKTSIDESIDMRTDNSTHIVLGAGIEYTTRSGLGVRAEYIAFDQDATYGQIALLYRLKNRENQRRRPVQIAESTEALVVEKKNVTPAVIAVPAIVAPPVMEPVVRNPVKVETVVTMPRQPCAATNDQSTLETDDCIALSGVIEGVNFHSGSANLTDVAQSVLLVVAEKLLLLPGYPVTVSAHTDSMGKASYNQQLSEQRAQAVVEFLTEAGVERSIMSAVAFGEDRPIASNETAEGRAKNRRVELELSPTRLSER